MAFNRNNRSGGGGRDFGRRRFDDRGGDRQMFKTTCSNCGKECEVPFKPTGSKPVYCRDCFRTMGGPTSRRTDDRGSTHPQYKEQFEALNAKLDKILKLLNPEKPIESPTVVIEPVKKKTKPKKLSPTVSDIPTEIVKE